MAEQQISKLLASLVEHQSAFSELPAEDAQWVIQNTKPAIAVIIKAIKNRPKSVELLLDSIGTITIPATENQFVAREHFVVNTAKKAKVKISYLGDNFQKEFLDKTEKPFAGSTLRYTKLLKSSVDDPIIAEIGGEAKAETSLTEMFSLMAKQGNGESGELLVNGWANVFYIRNSAGVLRAVFCYWDDGGWGVNAFSLEYPHRWYDGRRFFFRNSVSKNL